MIKLAVSGARGKMGQRIIVLALEDGQFELSAALESAGHPSLGSSVGGVKISSGAEEIKKCDVLIEFSSVEATLTHLEYAVKFGKKVIIGTTGLSDVDKKKIEDASRNISVVFSPNMSVGVNILFDLLKKAAGKLSNDYDINIIEAHHVHKKDAPSGTAKKLSEIIKQQGRKVKDIKSIREDEIVGDHKIIFSSGVDTIELSHSAKTRDIFVQGALVAAKWIINKNKGLYGMDDVLELK